MSGVHGGKLACPSGHPLDPLVGRSVAETNKRIFDPRGIGAPRSGAPTSYSVVLYIHLNKGMNPYIYNDDPTSYSSSGVGLDLFCAFGKNVFFFYFIYLDYRNPY